MESLPKLLHGVPVAPHVQRSDARQVAAAFKRARHYFSGMDECLSRGVAMRRVLAGKGCEARLVTGVTLPFAAQCWVQLGWAVLTDPLDVVTSYTPLLVDCCRVPFSPRFQRRARKSVVRGKSV